MVLYMTFGQRTVDHGLLVNGRLVKWTFGQRTFGQDDDWSTDVWSSGLFVKTSVDQKMVR